MIVERSFRGISPRLALSYLESVGAERVEGDRASAPGWTAHVEADTVAIGESIVLREVTVTFEGEEAVLEEVVEAFAGKAMRAGG